MCTGSAAFIHRSLLNSLNPGAGCMNTWPSNELVPNNCWCQDCQSLAQSAQPDVPGRRPPPLPMWRLRLLGCWPHSVLSVGPFFLFFFFTFFLLLFCFPFFSPSFVPQQFSDLCPNVFRGSGFQRDRARVQEELCQAALSLQCSMAFKTTLANPDFVFCICFKI